MWAHGGNPDLIPIDEFEYIEIMMMDGLIGHRQQHLLEAQILSTMMGWMSAGKARYPLKQFMPRAWDYIEPPEEDSADKKGLAQEKALIAFAMAMGAKIPEHILRGVE